jgi:alpha,alpha-trehalase
MAVWVLQRALEVLEVLPPHYRQELVDELTIRDNELDRWLEITRKMKVVFHSDGVLTQFEGYEQLLEFDWEGYRERYGNIQRLTERGGGGRATTAKLAAGRRLDAAVPAQATSYASRSGTRLRSDGRQLARTVIPPGAHLAHSAEWGGERLFWPAPEEAWQLRCGRWRRHRRRAGRTTAEGIHLGAMAGTVDIALPA